MMNEIEIEELKNFEAQFPGFQSPDEILLPLFRAAHLLH